MAARDAGVDHVGGTPAPARSAVGRGVGPGQRQRALVDAVEPPRRRGRPCGGRSCAVARTRTGSSGSTATTPARPRPRAAHRAAARRRSRGTRVVDEPDPGAARRRVPGRGVRVAARLEPHDHRLPGIRGSGGRSGTRQGHRGGYRRRDRDPGGDRPGARSRSKGPVSSLRSCMPCLPVPGSGGARRGPGVRRGWRHAGSAAPPQRALLHPAEWNDHAVAYRRARPPAAPPVRVGPDARRHPPQRSAAARKQVALHRWSRLQHGAMSEPVAPSPAPERPTSPSRCGPRCSAPAGAPPPSAWSC